MASRTFTEYLQTLHNGPALLDCNFIVDSTNGNGLGIRSLKGAGILNVFMNTSATPGVGNSQPNSGVVVTNPNPAAGTIVVQFQDNYFRSFSGFNSNVSPLSGTPLAVDATALTPGVAYVIVSLGTSTAADWVALGVGVGQTPQVGLAFIAKVSGAGSGTGMVEVTATAGVGFNSIETVGDPNTTINPLPSPNQGYGGQIILQTRLDGAIATPANGSVISLGFYLSNSSVLLAGE
jgi:hypothetical protein